MTPALTAFVTQTLIAGGVLFVIAYLGNLLTFSNRFVNALVTAILFAVLYYALVYFSDPMLLPPEVRDMRQETLIQNIAMAAIIVFVIDFFANIFSFQNRFVSALVTAILFIIAYLAASYSLGLIPELPTAA